ncbi:MAG: hypothetical protein AAGA80_05035 [Cyanobacteria bacterium P01_F01_bin.143]
MSTIVVVGLGYGLLQLTRATRDETSKVTARNESARAIEFISDELRRAQNVVDLTGFTSPTTSVDTADIRLALNIPGLADPVIYFVVPANDNWQGDLVINRWGPPLASTGDYDTGAWGVEPLLDGLDDTNQTADCNGTNVPYEGFFACRRPDGITAQLYFSSEIDIANTDYDKQYKADTQVVARARVRDTSATLPGATTPISFKTLGAEYTIGTRGGGTTCNGKTSWTMRTDFINDPNLDTPLDTVNPDNNYQPTTWIHDPDRQGQQINIDTDHKLTISSIPIGYNDCTGTVLSRGNETLDDITSTHTKAGDNTPWTPKDEDGDSEPDFETSDFTIDFTDPRTFNGNDKDDPNYDESDIPGVDYVKIYKKGSTLATYDGYDDDDSDANYAESSLGEFLASKGYAVLDGGGYRLVNDSDNLTTNPYVPTDPNVQVHPTLIKLDDNDRIIAVEIGQALVGDTFSNTTPPLPNPGFDLQDSVFILSTDVFAEKHTY